MLWLLKSLGGGMPGSHVAFVVRAPSQDEARQIVNTSEYPDGDFLPWLEPMVTSCVQILLDGPAGIIMEQEVSDYGYELIADALASPEEKKEWG